MVLNLYADIAARYARLNQSLAKGKLDQSVSATLSHQYAYPVGKDTFGMANLAAAQVGQINEGSCAIPFIISTTEVDRDGDIVESSGGDWGPYAGNPVVFFGHQSWQIPIGVSRTPEGQSAIYPEKNLIRATCYFDKPDPDAMFIYGKVQRGILSASSISFLPKQAYQRERGKAHSEDLVPLGWHFVTWQGTEWSVVGIPANAGALRDAYDSEKSFITPRLQKALAPYCAQAKGRCFTGYCPCPPCEEDMSKTLDKNLLTSALPGKPKSKKCKCGGKCSRCKGVVPNQDTGQEAANNPEGEHAREEEHTEHDHELQEAVAAKLPMLKEAGYDDAQSGAIAHHLAGKGVEGIEGHEEVARALGYNKDDMGGDSGTDGGDSVEMGLKEYLGAIRKSENEEKPDAEDSPKKPAEDSGEEEARDAEDDSANEEGPKFKSDALMLGHMHNHMKNAHEYLTKTLEEMPVCHAHKCMTKHLKDLQGHMDNYEEVLGKDHPDVKMDALAKHCKSLTEGDGEAEEVNEETGADGEGEATTETDKPEEDTESAGKTGNDLIREDYSTPKHGKRQVRKAMGQECLSAASMCMKEIASDVRTVPMHKAALLHHSAQVDGYCKSADAPETPMSDTGDSSMTEQAMKRLQNVLEIGSNYVFERSGQRI
jgi:phage head maturation protease